MAGGTLALPGDKRGDAGARTFSRTARIPSACQGATIRVYVNIGMFSEYWLTRHKRLIGLTPQKPFEIPYAREHSVFWRATEERLGNIAAFFRRLQPFHLADAPGGQSLHHNRRSRHDARKRSFRRELRGLSLEQTTAGEHRSALRRGKGVVPRSGDGARFSGEQFSFERQALSH